VFSPNRGSEVVVPLIVRAALISVQLTNGELETCDGTAVVVAEGTFAVV
jgi:hypothetical protein